MNPRFGTGKAPSAAREATIKNSVMATAMEAGKQACSFIDSAFFGGSNRYGLHEERSPCEDTFDGTTNVLMR